MSRWKRWSPLLTCGALCGALAAGCAHGPGVSAPDLELKRVVVYRNGVAYFERAGTVRSDQVRFRVRPSHVGDFLATLAVMEQGGSSVRSASFPVRRGKKSKGTEELETVVLDLDGEEHTLTVGYVSEQPIWRPSYRLVFGESGAPALQAWGIVQNLSGEDWEDVSLSLVAGAPISFEATLATPVTPRRPVVSDLGELIAAVPEGDSSLAEEHEQPREVPQERPEMEEQEPDMDSVEASPPSIDVGSMPPPPPPPMSQVPRPSSLMAGATVTAGQTRYDVHTPVTVPDQSATMVLLVAQEVPGESVFMFAPDDGVPDSARHPFRVARFTNSTAGLLERGPIAVYSAGTFLGQGVLEPLSTGGQATVPFALERGLAVDSSQRVDMGGARLARVEGSQFYIQEERVTRREYRVRNGGTEEAKVLLRHSRLSPDARLEAPPGTEDRVGEGMALVPVKVPARATEIAVVQEYELLASGAMDWMNPRVDEAVKSYLRDPRASPDVVAKLRAVWDLRDQWRETAQTLEKLRAERNSLEGISRATRNNLKALEKAPASANDVRKQLTSRLGDLDKRLAEVTERFVRTELQFNELRASFESAAREVRITEPLPRQ
ncbi:MAG TPA: DUF4139 domain-containing protein [Archangium sp.]|uniref:DUF4139 domain-containing protein n=1 Tax=Archangium sp. TaxID=1872627 RepID=UPI002ED8BD46